MSEHKRTELNNTAARRGQRVTYADGCSGPSDNPQWTSIVYLDNYEYGRGCGKTKGAAREAAASQALSLIAQGY